MATTARSAPRLLPPAAVRPGARSSPLRRCQLVVAPADARRQLHQSRARRSEGAAPDTESIPPRWLSDVKKRVGRCILWGLKPDQVGRAGDILKIVGEEWRELVAGSEGFLAGEKRAGLLSHNVVWGEMDSMGHVNNVMYIRYAESARVNWCQNIANHVDPQNRQRWSDLMTPKGDGMILRSIRTDYKFPMQWPDRISVFHKLRAPPADDADSFVLDVMILSERHQRAAARCVEDIVHYDYLQGKKTAMPLYMRSVFTDLFRQQQEAQAHNRRRVLDILAKVESLEKESWDCPDAKEDLGSASK